MPFRLQILAVLFLGLTFILSSARLPAPIENIAVQEDTLQRLTLLFVGDVMQHQAQLTAAFDAEDTTYEYGHYFRYISGLISSYDVAIANLEVTLAGPPYRGYPQFCSPDELAVALKNAGFGILVTANNHSCDRGRKGIERTIRVLDSLGLGHTGTFTDSSERAQTYPFIINKNGIKVALLNYTYGTNGLPIPAPNIVNMIDTALMAADLKAAKDSLPDKVIVCIHWGDEYKSHPNAFQKNTAEFLFRKGADIIIGSHPHVVQKMERFHFPDSGGREVIVAYSLGNYISNQRDRGRDGGATVGIELIRQNGETRIGMAGYYLSWVWITDTDGRRRYHILPVSGYEESGIPEDHVSLEKMSVFVNDSRQLFESENRNMPEIIFSGKAKEQNPE